MSRKEIWPNKYFPKELTDLVGNPKAVNTVYDFVVNWKAQKVKAILLAGPPGTGKTSSVYVVARKLEYEINEINASDVRNKDNILRIMGVSSLGETLFSKGRILLIDEVDGLSGNQDRGGVAAVRKILKSTKYPIIFTCNELYERKISSLRTDKLIKVVKFQRIKKDSIVKVLQKICKREAIEAELEALMKIAENTGGDMRSAIMDLQSLAEGKETLTYEDVISVTQFRNRSQAIFSALKQMFMERDPKKIRETISNTDISDWNLLIQWINEQIPHHMKDLKELVNAYHYLARADRFYSWIRTRQDDAWAQLPYVIEDMSIGVSLSRTETPFRHVKYFQNNPNFFFTNLGKFRRGPLVNACQKIREKTGKSIERILSEDLNFLSIIFKHDERQEQSISEQFDFEKPDRKAIKDFA